MNFSSQKGGPISKPPNWPESDIRYAVMFFWFNKPHVRNEGYFLCTYIRYLILIFMLTPKNSPGKCYKHSFFYKDHFEKRSDIHLLIEI